MTLTTTQWFRVFGWALLPLVIAGLPICGVWLLHFSWRATALRWVLLVQGGIGTLVSFLMGLTTFVRAPHRGRDDYYEFFWSLIWVFIGSFVCFGIYERRQWARRVLVILSGAEFASALLAVLLLGFATDNMGLAVALVGVALYGGVMWYMLTTPEVKLEFSA